MAYPGQPHQPYPPQYPPQHPAQYGPPVPQLPPSPAAVPSMRVDIVQGTPFGVAYPLVASTPSGPSIGSLVAGIASILVALFAACLGVSGSEGGWGPAAGGAFTALAVFLGLGGVGLGVYGMRQIRNAGRAVTGKGMAVTGVVLGSVGAGLGVFALLLAFLLAV
jgi:hypothetical protein